MNKHNSLIALGIVGFLILVSAVLLGTYYYQSKNGPQSSISAQSNQIIITEPPISGNSNLQLRTFTVISLTPTITPTPWPTVPQNFGGPVATHTPGNPWTLITGGPVSLSDPVYCIDDEDADGCDDNTAYHVPKGTGGTLGTCGTIILWAHKIVESLPHFLKGLRDTLSPAITSTCNPAGTGTYSSGYISTFFVIDAFNLAGYPELSKNDPQHVEGISLVNWWKTAPGYTFIPYSPTVIQEFGNGQRDLTGCVMFMKISNGVFPGIVNKFELLNSQGDGVISMLQSGVSFYLDRFEVVSWDIQNTILHLPSQGEAKQLQGVAGFGCHQ